MSEIYTFSAGTAPLLVSFPHDGQHVPGDISALMTDDALRLPDTDWHVQRLYDFAGDLGASVIAATHSRYVVDLNRDPAGGELYPGADNTEVVPTSTFDHAPIYRPGVEPREDDVAERIKTYWQPYHDKLAHEIEAIRTRFGIAVVFEAHSIRSEVPRFFDGRLPDFNFGTASGESAHASLTARAYRVLDGAVEYTAALNGRFTGGYITRHYGDPANHVHALQLEQSQCTYMDERLPFDYRPMLADKVRPVLRQLLEEIVAWTGVQP